MRLLVFAAATLAATGQTAQNPSPMVEHTRTHPRIPKQQAQGRRFTLDKNVTLFVPAKWRPVLLVFFHGGDWLPETAGARNRMAVIALPANMRDPARLSALLAEAERAADTRFQTVILGGWSLGCTAVREVLKSPEVYARVSGLLLIDGIHAGYKNGKPGPLESELETDNLESWVRIVKDAMAGRKRIIVTHSEIFPGTFASTTETADYLLRTAGVPRRAVLKWGPMRTQQLSEAKAGRFLLIGYAGNSAPDHVDQLHSLAEYLRWMR